MYFGNFFSMFQHNYDTTVFINTPNIDTQNKNVFTILLSTPPGLHPQPYPFTSPTTKLPCH